MEYMYGAMLLHKAGSEINEKNLTKVLEAAGVKVDKAKVTVVVNALKGVDIEKALKETSVAPVAAAAPTAAGGSAGGAPAEPKEVKEQKAEEKKEEVKEEKAAEGLGALFG